jgi:DNA-directed RNA polymerase specialized sigma24 family protein
MIWCDTAMPPKTERWTLTRQAFDRLLLRLGKTPEAGAQEYDAIRRKLVSFFRIRGILPAEALADETIDRVARKIDEGGTIDQPRAYFYGVARHVALEWEKSRVREQAALGAHPLAYRDDTTLVEARVACLERCLKALPENSRVLIVDYYQDVSGSHVDMRKLLAQRFGITYAGLKTRAHRIRAQLEDCLAGCLRGEKIELPIGPEGHSL